MNLAFYYHIPITQKNQDLYTPGFLGVFIDSLASEVKHLYLVMHQSNETESESADYKLKNNNITFINLRLKTPAWHRAIFHKKILKKVLAKIDNCDAIIVRSPSPLAPYFYRYLKNTKLIFMVVGDYMEAVKQTKSTTFREKIVNLFLSYNHKKFKTIMKKVDVLVNSPTLFNTNKNNAKSIHLIKTTTLSINDFYLRKDTCTNDPIELLYTGRFDIQKGLVELVEATAELITKKVNVCLNFVGWENDGKKPVEKLLTKKAKDLKIENNVIFHGKKTIGKELNKMYQMADIYVLPSYHEGFPRTIWEAMANSLPVIATKVGGIPNYLTDKKNVFLIEPKKIEQITNAIETIINNINLRQNLINNGVFIAKDATLELQAQNIINHIKTIINE